MVNAHESWDYSQHSPRQLPDLNCMNASLNPRQPESLPTCVNPGNYMFSANVSLPGFAVPALEKTKMEKVNGAHRLLQILPPRLQTLVAGTYPYERQPAVTCGFSANAIPKATSGSMQKGLFVFDQSGNQTRLLYSSNSPSVLNAPASIQNLVNHGFLEEQAVGKGQFTSMKPILHEESDENCISDKEYEMHEDTEEINALLYSDEDDDYSSDDDEVKSTDHSPVAIGGNCEKYELIAEISEEVASSDGPNKRQKLLDGGCNKSLQTDTACSVQIEASHEFDNDAESSHASGKTRKKEMSSVFGFEQSRKDKIHKTLRILQGIIPNANGKDPMSVLDEAIDYLQSLKLKAMALGV